MNSTASAQSTAKPSLTGFVHFLGTISKADLVGYILLALVVLPVAAIYEAVTLPSRAFNPRPEDEGYLATLATRSWTRYKDSLSE